MLHDPAMERGSRRMQKELHELRLLFLCCGKQEGEQDFALTIAWLLPSHPEHSLWSNRGQDAMVAILGCGSQQCSVSLSYTQKSLM